MRLSRNNYITLRYPDISSSNYWSIENRAELMMHKIHVYPAKFPSFLISKTLNYASLKGLEINTIGDIFCGCGTTALEAKKAGKNFWGCDINPVATLITKVKTNTYSDKLLVSFYEQISTKFERTLYKVPKNLEKNVRIKFWFDPVQTQKLYTLKRIILSTIKSEKYRDFFLVAFSNILKGASKWLTKSIKPTIDPNKKIKCIKSLFAYQFRTMLKATREYKSLIKNYPYPKSKIVTDNFLKIEKKKPFLDLLITSPPYVTSYEYADLHQLSTLWLGFTNDYRSLREGTIGSLFHKTISEDQITSDVNEIGKRIYFDLVKAKKSKAKSIAKYFIDIKQSIEKSYSVIRKGGLAVFVIGNTVYKDVYVDNAKYATACLFESGFTNVNVYKRKISSKILSPYRDQNGKFSRDKRKRQIYNYEFILIAKK